MCQQVHIMVVVYKDNMFAAALYKPAGNPFLLFNSLIASFKSSLRKLLKCFTVKAFKGRCQ
jgi:hypothetical protein